MAKQRATLYQLFLVWLQAVLPNFGVEELVLHHGGLFGQWCEEFVIQAYVEGWSRTKAANAVLSVMDQHGICRTNLGLAWAALRTWEGLEPPRLHPPMPWKLLKAMVVCALAWQWPGMAASLLLGFCCLLRPSENWRLTFGDIAWPWEHDGGEVLYIGVEHHKTDRRGPRKAHVKLDRREAVRLLCRLQAHRPRSERIFAGSPATFRRRFDALAARFHMKGKVLPSSLRPGGATQLFMDSNESLDVVQWRGRWASARVLRHYIQELGAMKVLAGAPQETKYFIGQVADLFDDTCANFGNERGRNSAVNSGDFAAAQPTHPVRFGGW